LAVVVARFLAPGDAAEALRPELFAAAGAFLGHVLPIWLSFRGGKGVATFVGCLLGIAWPAAVGFGLVWLAIARLTHYSSVAALGASVAAPVVLFAMGRHDAALVFGVLASILWTKHRANIERLLAGTESRIGQK
jgi:glycerol-3-phosphate acyltransferase PlsY